MKRDGWKVHGLLIATLPPYNAGMSKKDAPSRKRKQSSTHPGAHRGAGVSSLPNRSGQSESDYVPSDED